MSTREQLLGRVKDAAGSVVDSGATLVERGQVGAERLGEAIPPRLPSAKQAILGTLVVVIVLGTLVPLSFLVWTGLWSGYPGQLDAALTVGNFVRVYVGGFFDVAGLFTNSLTIAVGMTLTGMAVGLTFAWLFVRTNVPTKSWMELVLLSGQGIPGYIYAIMYITSYGPENGLLSTFLRETVGLDALPFSIFSPWGIAFVAGISVIPTFYLLTVPAIQDMNPALEEVSRIHGASTLGTIRSVSIPIIKPAILSAALVTFLYGLGEFAVVAILGARNGFDVYSTAIWKAIGSRFPPAYGEAAALGCSLLLVTLLLVWYYRRVTRRKSAFMTVTGRGYHSQHWDLGRWRWPVALALWTTLVVIWVVPTAVMVLASLHTTWFGHLDTSALTLTHYAEALANPQLRDAFANSLVVAGAGATLGTVLVVGMAYYTERTKARLRGVVDFLSLTPLAVPGIIMGSSLLFTFLWVGKVHSLFDLYGTLAIIVIGSVIVFIPVSSRIAVGNIVQIHSELEEAARIAGASWLQQMREIFLPLFRNTAAVIWFFLAIHIFQLLTIAVMTYTTDTVVVPVKLFQLYMFRPSIELVSAISTLIVGLTVLLLLGLRALGITFYDSGR